MQRGRGRRGTIHGRFKGAFIGGVANEADGGEHGWKEGGWVRRESGWGSMKRDLDAGGAKFYLRP